MENLPNLNSPAFSNFKFSSEINELVGALSAAQEKIHGLKKDTKGHGYNYSSLLSTINEIKVGTEGLGLAVSQLPINATINNVTVLTMLMHKSGQYLHFETTLPTPEIKRGNAIQQAGAGITYTRRYTLQALFNMSSEDTDGTVGSEDETKPVSTKTASFIDTKSTKGVDL